MKKLLSFGFIAAFAVSGVSSISRVSAEDASPVASWRGPSGSGSVLDGTYATKWNDSTNIKWRAKLPGRGASTPIAVEGKIYLTAADESKNYLICVGSDGTVEWKKEVGSAVAAKNAKASGANSSPVSDGKHIFAYFKSGDVIASTLEGDIVWQTNLQEKYGENTLWWDLGTSPVLTEESVVIAVMQAGPSFLVSFDKASGKEVWKTDRQYKVTEESDQAYTTPAVHYKDSTETLLTLGADHLTAHDSSGNKLWELGGFNAKNQRYFRSIASPVVVGDLVICPYSRGNTLTAVRLGKDIAEKDRIAWFRDDLGADVPTPAVDGNRIFVLGDKGQVSSLDVETGKTLHEMSLPKHRAQYSSSPIFANGHLYCTREDATTFVVDIEKETLVSENELAGDTVATPVFADGKIYIRTYEELVCIQGS